jgi:hypothetical protein
MADGSSEFRQADVAGKDGVKSDSTTETWSSRREFKAMILTAESAEDRTEKILNQLFCLYLRGPLRSPR